MENYLYFRTNATLAQDDDVAQSGLFPVSSFLGMHPTSGTALTLFFKPRLLVDSTSSLALNQDTDLVTVSIPVKLAPLIAGKVPVILAAGIAVRLAALIAGKAPVSLLAVRAEILASATVPVRLPAGIDVKLAALVAGNVEGNLASATVPVNLLAATSFIWALSTLVAA